MHGCNNPLGYEFYSFHDLDFDVCFCIFFWFIRATAYSVHGVSGVLIFLIGSFIFTIVIGFNVYICRKFGIFKRLKESWIDLRGH
jgi:hypothetical protein